MAESNSNGEPIRHVSFGPFQVDFETGEVHKHGLRLNLQDKPLRVLQALVEKPGQLVTREELRNRLWPEDHYVEFDRNLTIAMNRLRTVLSDSADQPRFIETLPRRGYRFIHALNGEGPSADASAPSGRPPTKDDAAFGREAPTPLAVRENVTAPARRWSRVWLVGTLALAMILGTVVWYRSARLENAQKVALSVVPVTSSPGQKGEPAFSPDGSELAYSWRGEKNQSRNIYVKLIGAGPPLRLTSASTDDCSPAWSPDGRQLAFLREGGLFVISALGGPARKLADAYVAECASLQSGRLLDWSPDGKFLVVGDLLKPEDSRPSILLVSVENGHRTALVSRPATYVECLAISPDARTIAYAAGVEYVHDIYIVPVTGGEPRKLTSDRQFISGLSWTADGNRIVFSSTLGGLASLWTVSVSGGTPEPVNLAGPDTYLPSVARKGDRMAYLRQNLNQNLWRASGPNSTRPPGAPAPLIVTSGVNEDVDIAPDGKKIAFSSDRSGKVEIWISNSDGTDPWQLTTLGGGEGSPRWSPDGQTIAFDSLLEGHGDIFVVGAEGGSPRRLTNEPFQNVVPTWSQDGRWIYFTSDRTGSYEIWKVPVAGGPAVEITTQGGFIAYEAPDGKAVYYGKGNAVWSKPVEGGQETHVLDTDYSWFWRVIAGGICFVDFKMTPYRLKFLDFSTHRVREFSKFDVGIQNPPLPNWGSFAVSPDGKWILYGHRDAVTSDIMMLEGFH